MSGYSPDPFRSLPSEALVHMAKEALDEVGHFPDLKKQLDDILRNDSPPKSLEDPHSGNGLY